MMLHYAMIERLGLDVILAGHHLVDWEETATGIRVRFLDKVDGGERGVAEGSLRID
jgi:hypothetical protein